MEYGNAKMTGQTDLGGQKTVIEEEMRLNDE